MNPTVEQLQEAGFTAAATELMKKADLKRRLVVAYEHYRYVTQEKVDAFLAKQKKATEKMSCGLDRGCPNWATMSRYGGYTHEMACGGSYDSLLFTKVEEYANVPPVNVLQSLSEARSRNIFDSFEVCTVKSVVIVPDPIIFGRITGCGDRFFIDQWGDDIRIADILSESDG